MISRRILLAMAACAILSTPAVANTGGGTKKDSTISVRNDTSTAIAAFIDPDPARIANLNSSSTRQQIENAGGKLINPGATADFKVTAGTYQLAAGTDVSNSSAHTATNVTVGKGQTRKFAYNTNNTLTPF